MSTHERERLSAYLDGELPAVERAEVEAHLRACEGCSERLAELAAVDEAARELPLPVPEGYFDSFPARLRPRLRAGRRAVLARPWALAAAAALFLAVLAPWILRQAPPRLEAPTPRAVSAPEPAGEARATLSKQEAGQDAAAGAVADSVGEKREDRVAAGPARARPAAPMAPAATVPANRAPGELQEEAAEVTAGLERDQRDEAAAAPREGGFAAAPPPAAAPPHLAAARDAGAAASAPVAAEKKAEQDGKGRRAAGASAETRAREAHGDAETVRRQGSSLAARHEASETEDEAASLRRRPATSLAQTRTLRDDWRALSLRSTGPLADEAWVRAVELGVRAFELSSDPADRAAARRDAAAYLARPDATRAPHVRALLASLGD